MYVTEGISALWNWHLLNSHLKVLPRDMVGAAIGEKEDQSAGRRP